MSAQLLQIHPLELKFTFEVKKQSSCAIHLSNVSDQHVAFKVKTTSPKKYCVRPNIGIIKPKATCDFTVSMQAQRLAPSDVQCKDKFLIQSTVVPFETTEEDITSGMFTKDSGTKLRVVLTSPPHSPVLLPIKDVSKQEPSYEASIQKDKLPRGVENLPPSHRLHKVAEDVKSSTHMEEPRLAKVVEDKELSSAKDVEFGPVKDVKPRPVKDVEGTELKLAKEIEALKSKLNVLDSNLIEAEFTISKLKEEKSTIFQEKGIMKQKLAVLRRNKGVRKVQVGFPFLFVCMVALISLTVGYLVHP